MLPPHVVARFSLDEGKSCPAVSLYLTVSGDGSYRVLTGSLANTTISGTTTTFYVFNDNVTANVNYIANSTSGITTQGALNWTGSASGLGALPKTGPGVMTMGTALKRYTGPTVFSTDSGRIRISVVVDPQTHRA